MNRPSTLLLTTLALAPVWGPAVRGDDDSDEARPTLTVQGQAEVAVAPDTATVRLGATIQAAEAALAQRQVNEILHKAIAEIRAAGVPDEKIQTAQLTLSPVYGQRPPVRGVDEPSEPRIVGYRATNTIQVVLDDLTKVGAVIDAGMASGANELQGVDFGLRDDLPQRIEALRAATEEAERKARAIADAAGVAIAGVRSIQEGGYAVMRPQPNVRAAMMAESAGAPVQPGQVRVQASVTMTLFLEPRRGG